MKLHNTNEEVVLNEVNIIFDSFEKSGNPENICTCLQCRMDTACYVLNRIEPRYILSNRGAVRVEQESLANQQKKTDIVAAIYEGIKKVTHNRRMVSDHATPLTDIIDTGKPVFNIPPIIGRLFNGLNFAPLEEVNIELRSAGKLVSMMDNNWQNPYHLVSHHEGTFTFWPLPIQADALDVHSSFEFSVIIAADGFETLTHHFSIPVTSEAINIMTYSRARTFKLSDLFVFPLGEAEDFE